MLLPCLPGGPAGNTPRAQRSMFTPPFYGGLQFIIIQPYIMDNEFIVIDIPFFLTC